MQTFGPYVPSRVLAQGGMSVVYLAEHRETGERVALKTVRVPNEIYLASLRREVHALGKLRHPSVVRIVAEGIQENESGGVPWYAIVVLPLLFAAGMSLLDCLDGLFMSVAYDWAFLRPARKVYYNLTITGLSVAVALLIGLIELIAVLHDRAGWDNWFTDPISAIDLNNVGFIVVGIFVVVWAAALGYWKLARVEERWPA